MSLLSLLIVLVVLVGPVLAIVGLFQVFGAKRRITALEAEIVRLAQQLGAADAASRAQSPDPVAEIDTELARPPFAWAKTAVPTVTPQPAATRDAEPEPILAPAPVAPLTPPPLVLLGRWLSVNWVYVVSAASLGLAGIFFVQYGIEAGLLPPPLRVLAGLMFGGGLVAAGEWLRRRYGSDEQAGTTIYLPSVFSGAGLVAIFAALAAGRLMYGLYGPGLAFAGLFATALGAVWLGWRNGPFLAAIGLIGASAAPFLVGGGAAPTAWLYGYYILILGIGLAVDAWRQWGWVSILAMVLAQLGLLAMREGGAGVEPWLLAQGAFVLLSILLPGRSLTPRHAGSPVSFALWRREELPAMPVKLAFGAVLVASAQVFAVQIAGPLAGLMPYLALTLMTLVLLWWAEEAEALSDLAVIPALAFLARLGLDEAYQALWLRGEISLLPPETPPALWASWLFAMAAAMSGAAAWRALRVGGLIHALAAVLIAPIAALLLEALWRPSLVLGPYLWALHLMALAGAMVWLATAFAKADGGAGRRSAWATLSALSLIALSLFVLTSAAALTLALGVLVVAAVALDRRFALPEMAWFIQAAAVVITYRLVVDPGIAWAETAALPAVVLAHLGVTAACGVAWMLLRPLADRGLPRAVVESLGAVSAALLFNVIVLRQLPGAPLASGEWSTDYLASHWGATLMALPWLLLLGSQLWRAAASEGWGRKLRLLIAGGAGLFATMGLVLAVTVFNPLWWGNEASARVLGPPLLDTLALAYAVPGALLLAYLRFPTVLPLWARRGAAVVGGALVTLYAVTEIRRLWHGPDIGSPGVLQGELYSYTLALLLTGAVLLWQALARRSVPLRRVAMAVIALTVAKVFLWDVSGLSGLVRVLSFAGLGLSLAALAWLNRWAGQVMEEQPPE